ncbi:MAG: phosphocholine cytidylyltransferase/choline kinase family protein [Clostridium sp.]|nr:phosphocholine cytidylyltransferase/choline kinase family protein [Clostridium sp.]
MDIRESNILKTVFQKSNLNQRILAELCGYSLGTINKLAGQLVEKGLITQDLCVTQKGKEWLDLNVPHNAIILAAGYGMRTVPLNMEVPKGLLEINGEPLVEHTIKQLHDVGIHDICIIVGYMKEQYEYLIDEYNVELVVNPEYHTKNNLYSLSLAADRISNTYIIPCDVWCAKNPFDHHELYSWYMINDLVDDNSTIRINRKMELVNVKKGTGGNGMIGISYLTEKTASIVRDRLNQYKRNPQYDDSFWEIALCNKNKMLVYANMVSFADVIEINTYEQLRDFDSSSNQLNNAAIHAICDALYVDSLEITDIAVLKKGMTNRSFLFSCRGKKYIMRIPGEGTDQLINRQHESEVYQAICNKEICDNIFYMNPENGYKITEFFENARVCDPGNMADVKRCMDKLREFHQNKYVVGHEFDLFKQIDFYERLWDGIPSIYRDYEQTKTNVFKLKGFVEKYCEQKILTHIDAVPDNFLFIQGNAGQEEIRLIDWEYAGMQDPHVDIAMFAIYSLYEREQVEKLIDAYFEQGCDNEIRIKIYCYIAICGLLWSNWCEYKRKLGVEFGEYSLKQYRYAKQYYKVVQKELGQYGSCLEDA